MKRVGLGIALILCGVAEAAQPPASAPVAVPPVSKPAAAQPPSSKPVVDRMPLDLRVGDIRDYMLPDGYQAALAAPDAEKNTIVVQGTKLLPMRSLQPIPAGFPPATLWWALGNPSQSWRIILPDLNAPAAGRPDPVPPPIFRRGP
jgi:hypothetical protein